VTILRKAIAALALLAAIFASLAPAAEGVPPPQSEVSKAMDFLNAVGRLDFDNAGALLDEKTVLELPYVGDGQTVNGKMVYRGGCISPVGW
jgi:hypothetical protein